MSGKKAYRIAVGVVCALLCAQLILGALGMYRQGTAARAAGEPSAPLYTRQGAAALLGRSLPLAFALLALIAAGRVRGVREERRPASFVEHRMGQKTEQAADRRARALRWALLAGAAAMIAVGAWNGGMRDVLIKAIQICTECVGLG